MGGQEGSRGYLYQAIAAVIEALLNENWDKIYLEFSSEKDKVDVALEENNRIIKAIQVKSTFNSFQKTQVVNWLLELIEDNVGAICVQIYLIGSCTEGVTKFFESIKKYKKGNMDETAKSSLASFDCSKINNIEVDCSILPYEANILRRIARDSLNKYLSKQERFVTFEKLDFIIGELINEQMFSSALGQGIERETFQERVNSRLALLSK